LNKKLIGVWFSLALVIMGAGIWLGYEVGFKFAGYWIEHQRKKQEILSGLEWPRFDLTLSDLEAIGLLQFALSINDDKNQDQSNLISVVKGYEHLKSQSNERASQRVVDLYLGFSYVEASMMEEQKNNKKLAAVYMKSAQSLFQSLGWQDSSDDTLKSLARRLVDIRNVPRHARDVGK